MFPNRLAERRARLGWSSRDCRLCAVLSKRRWRYRIGNRRVAEVALDGPLVLCAGDLEPGLPRGDPQLLAIANRGAARHSSRARWSTARCSASGAMPHRARASSPVAKNAAAAESAAWTSVSSRSNKKTDLRR
jgi:hypothetical protein